MANAIVNPYSATQPVNGTLLNDFTDPSGAKLVSDAHAKQYNYAKAGVLYHGCSVIAGNSAPIYSTTAPVFCLWNTSSAVNLVLLSFRMGYISGTGVPAPLYYTWGQVGTSVAVGVTAFNSVTSSRWLVPGLVGGSQASSRASFSNAATNTIVALTNQMPSNLSWRTITAASTDGQMQVAQEDFEGSVILTPGTFFFPSALLASVSLFSMRLTWAEIPV